MSDKTFTQRFKFGFKKVSLARNLSIMLSGNIQLNMDFMSRRQRPSCVDAMFYTKIFLKFLSLTVLVLSKLKK